MTKPAIVRGLFIIHDSLFTTRFLLFHERSDDRGEKPREALVDLRASRCVLPLPAASLAADQPCLAQRLEVLRQGRLRYRLLVRIRESSTGMRSVRVCDLRKDRHTIL